MADSLETPVVRQPDLKTPWLIAVWPGMGHVGINAAFYLASKLEMTVFAEFSPHELFDVESVDVQNGIIRPGRLPRSRLFVWRDPNQKRDLVLFIGEAQPPSGKRAFCRGLIQVAAQLGVKRVMTFAAMATQMHPARTSAVYVAATDEETLDDLSLLDVKVLREGSIGGLNGVLLGAAAEGGMQGACLLGEMPHIFAQLPFPGGSLAVLKTFSELTGITLDLGELEQQATQIAEQVGELLAQVEADLPEGEIPELEAEQATPEEAPKIPPREEQRLETLFDQAREDRSKAYELKRELDRLGVFADYEDRFLDLFRTPEA